MRKFECLLVSSLVLAGNSFLIAKEKKPDPRLKQIHTVFIKDEHTQASAAAQANIEKWTCLKTAPSEDQADAVMTVLWVKESKDTTVPISSPEAAAERPISIGTNPEYRTTLVVNAREGSKFKKIWSKSVALGQSDETRKSGVERLMEDLKAQACGQP